MKTGFNKLDKIIEINKGDLIIVASKPAMGKTSLACNVANYILTKDRETVLFFELEESMKKAEKRPILSNRNIETKDLPIYIIDEPNYIEKCKILKYILYNL